MHPIAKKFIEKHGLIAHSEGGYFKETYRAADVVKTPPRFKGERSSSTAIYYVLEGKDFSSWHKLLADEIWHHYAGSIVNIAIIEDAEKIQLIKLGDETANKEAQFQAVIKHGQYFAAELAEPNSYAIMGCTVSPGFDYSDFQLADREDLLVNYPKHSAIIKRLSRE